MSNHKTIIVTDEQIKQMALNAINASTPLGMGFLHYEEKNYKIEDLRSDPSYIYLDYFMGRMVKLSFRKKDNNWIVTRGSEPHPEYQSWIHKYPTIEKLAESVGAKGDRKASEHEMVESPKKLFESQKRKAK